MYKLVKGVEIEATKKLSQQVDFRVGYSYMDGLLTKGDANIQGNQLNNVPKHSLSANLGYQISPSKKQKTAINLGAAYVGQRQGDLANSFTVDHFVRADFSLKHDLSKHATLNLSIKNLFDKDYISASYSPITLTVGYPRRTVLSFEYRF